MLVLGLLLILGSAALGAGLVYDGSEAAKVEILGTTVDTTMAGVFFSGAATMLVFLVGVWMLQSKMGRSRRKRVERKEARRRQRESVAKLEQERIQLAAENERLAEKLGTRQDAAVDDRQDTTVDARRDKAIDARQDKTIDARHSTSVDAPRDTTVDARQDTKSTTT
jgi:ABC-type nickel/cobalt efflux system permease component RcnA